MDCADVRDNLDAYIDGTLDRKYTKCMEMHLEKCEQCRHELISMEMLIEAVKDIEMEEPPTDLRMRIAAATTRSIETRPAFTDILRNIFRPAPAKWAAGAVTAGVIAVWLTVGFNPDRPEIARNPVIYKHSTPVIAEIPKEAAVEKNEVARNSSEPVRTVEQTSRRNTYAIKQYKSEKKAGSVNLALKPGHKPASVQDLAEKDSSVIEATVEEETQPVDTQVASVSEPAPEVQEEKIQEQHPAVVKVAAAPVLNQQDTEAWMQQVKNQAAMHKRNRGSGEISLITAKF